MLPLAHFSRAANVESLLNANVANDYTSVTPSSGNVSVSRAGNAMIYDSTGKLTFASNNAISNSQVFNSWASINAITIADNNATAPDGTTTAALVAETTANAAHWSPASNVSLSVGDIYIASLYMKKGPGATAPNIMQLSNGNSAFGTSYANFNLNTGAVVNSAGVITAGIISAGNGWYRCYIVATVTTTATTAALLYAFTNNLSNNGRGPVYAGSTTSNVYVWGGQAERVTYQTTPSTYIATTAAAYYGPRLDYLYNGSSWISNGLLVEGAATNLNYSGNPFATSSGFTANSATIVNTGTTGPAGTNTGFLQETVSGVTYHTMDSATITVVNGSTYCWSMFAKAGGRQYVKIIAQELGGATPSSTATFDLTGGTCTAQTGSPASYGVTPVGNGWYRCWVSRTITNGTTVRFSVAMSNASNGADYAGDGSSGVYFYGFQVELGLYPTSFIFNPAAAASTTTRAAETLTLPAYASQLVLTTRKDAATGATFRDTITPGATFTPNNGWISALRVYTGGSASSLSLPSHLTLSRAGNAMLYDSTGKLTYAPNNLVISSSNITNASYWFSNALASVNGGQSDPFGGTNAVSIIENTSNAAHTRGTSTGAYIAIPLGTYIISAYVKQLQESPQRWVALEVSDFSANGAGVEVNLATGAISQSSLTLGSGWTPSNASVTNVGNGWYRVFFTLTVTANPTTTGSAYIILRNASSTTWYPAYAGNGTAGALISSFQVERVTYQTAPSTYVATTSAAYYGPRFDYNPSTLAPIGLMEEAAATNLALQSGDFGNAAWTKSQLTAASSTVAAPDGVSVMTTLTGGGTTTAHELYNTTAYTTSTGTVYVASAYVKAGTCPAAFICLQMGAPGISATFTLSGTSDLTATQTFTGTNCTIVSSGGQYVGNGIFRIWIAGSVSSLGTSTYMILGQAQTSGNTFSFAGEVNNAPGSLVMYAWGAQVAASNYPTSYIPTTTASVTRAAETLSAALYSTQPAIIQYRQASVTNLLTYSETFSNGAWVKDGLSAASDAMVNPNGGSSVFKLTENSANAQHRIYQDYGTALSGMRTVYAKSAGNSRWLFIEDAGASAWFNLETGALGTVGSGGIASIQNVGNGWYRCALNGNSTGSRYAIFGMSNADNVKTYTGDGTSSVYIWGAQLEQAAVPGTYVATTTAATTATPTARARKQYSAYSSISTEPNSWIETIAIYAPSTPAARMAQFLPVDGQL